MYNKRSDEQTPIRERWIIKYGIITVDGFIVGMMSLLPFLLGLLGLMLLLPLTLILGPWTLATTIARKLAWYMKSIQRQDWKEQLLESMQEDSLDDSPSYLEGDMNDGEVPYEIDE